MSPDESNAPIQAPNAGDKPAPVPHVPPHEVIYPHIYTWYVLVSALDIMFTWMMFHLFPRHAKELNVIAEYVMIRWDLPGMVAFKFILVSFVIIICEFVGRRRHKVGRAIALFAVGVTCVPVIAAAVQMLLHSSE